MQTNNTAASKQIKIGNYILGKTIGKGNSAVVKIATHAILKQKVKKKSLSIFFIALLSSLNKFNYATGNKINTLRPFYLLFKFFFCCSSLKIQKLYN